MLHPPTHIHPSLNPPTRVPHQVHALVPRLHAQPIHRRLDLAQIPRVPWVGGARASPVGRRQQRARHLVGNWGGVWVCVCGGGEQGCIPIAWHPRSPRLGARTPHSPMESKKASKAVGGPDLEPLLALQRQHAHGEPAALRGCRGGCWLVGGWVGGWGRGGRAGSAGRLELPPSPPPPTHPPPPLRSDPPSRVPADLERCHHAHLLIAKWSKVVGTTVAKARE